MFKPFVTIIFLLFFLGLNAQNGANKELNGVLEEAESYINQGMLDEAEELLKTLIEKHPSHLVALSKYGSVLIQKNDSSGAYYLKKVLAKEADYLFAHKELGRFYLMGALSENKKLERAQSLGEKEKLNELTVNRDSLLNQMIYHFERVIKIEPRDVLTLRSLRNVYGLKEDKENFDRIVDLMKVAGNCP